MRDRSVFIPIWQLALFYLVIAFALYWRVLGLSFFADDFTAVWRIGVQGEFSTSFFRPLSELSIWKNHLVFGTDPTGYRITNVILHWLNALMLALLLQRTIVASDQEFRYAPAFAGLLFLCYPFHNEGVVWIVGRGASLSTLCVLLGLLAALSSLTDRWRIIWSSIAFFMGALAYETALIFPLIALPVLWLNGTRGRLLGQFGMSWIAMLLLHFVSRSFAIEKMSNSYGADFFSQPWLNYFSNIPKVFGRSFVPPNADPNAMIMSTIMVGSIVLTIAWLYVRHTRDVRTERINALAWCWMLIATCAVPVITSVSTRTSESDRFLYMPSVFLCGLIAMVLFRIIHGPLRWFVIGILLVASECFLQQNNDNWIKASRTIESIVAISPVPEPGTRILVSGLPGDTCGAFMFRHGYHEALLMAGRDTTGVEQFTTDGSDALLDIRDHYQVFHWNGSAFDLIR